jgi:hypothetical protein
MSSKRDTHYKPVYEAIRAKLVAETGLRKARAVEAWILTERECVLREVNRQRGLRAYDPVDLATIERAERQALGHSDYVSKYAHAAADLVLRKEAAWPRPAPPTQGDLPCPASEPSLATPVRASLSSRRAAGLRTRTT